jgi:putative transposase
VERSRSRYEARPDRNAELREEMLKLARQKPRYGYRRLHALLQRRGYEVKHEVGLSAVSGGGLERAQEDAQASGAGCAVEAQLTGPNQEWAMDFVVDGLAMGRMVRILSVVDAYTHESVALEANFNLGSRRVTRVLERAITERGRPENVRSDNGPEFTLQRMISWAEGAHPAWPSGAKRARGKLPREAARRVTQHKLVPHSDPRAECPG